MLKMKSDLKRIETDITTTVLSKKDRRRMIDEVPFQDHCLVEALTTYDLKLPSSAVDSLG
jgi:hypothetical protein